MFRIKICGVTCRADAGLIADAGADAIGLNFYPQSRRYVTVEQAEACLRDLPPRITRVGLFVNATDDEVCRIFDHLQLDMIQLHGDEPPEFLPSLGPRPVLRAFRLGRLGVRPIVEYLDECRALGSPPCGVLVDASQPGQYGGTGKTADWDLLRAERTMLGDLPLVLAGGLRPDNVAAAIEQVAPDAVDTSSGVELSAGRKDARLVRDFIATAADALARVLK